MLDPDHGEAHPSCSTRSWSDLASVVVIAGQCARAAGAVSISFLTMERGDPAIDRGDDFGFLQPTVCRADSSRGMATKDG